MALKYHRELKLVAIRMSSATRRSDDCAVVQDPVERDFTARSADELWVADITYIPTWAGFLYLAVVLDAWSRRVVGWAMAVLLRTELVLDASTWPWRNGGLNRPGYPGDWVT